MSHLPIKPVDYYLDKLQNKHVLIVGGIAIIMLILFGPTLSNLLFVHPISAPSAGQYSQHYPDGVLRTATTPPPDELNPRLYYSAPFVVPPYQETWHDSVVDKL